MITDIESTLAAGFDPDALLKIDLDTQERFNLLSQDLNTGPDPSTAFPKLEPFVPKDLNTSDFLFKDRNNIDPYKLIDSGDPEKIKMGYEYLTEKGRSSDAFRYGLSDYVYKTNATVEKLKEKGYGYDITQTAVQNEDAAYKMEKDSHWWVTNAVASVAKGLVRLPGQMLLKAAGIGAKAAAIYDYIAFEDGSKDLLTSMGDNMMVRYIQYLDDDYKENFLSSLKTSEYEKAGFFSKMKYSQFWTDEAVDFASYMLVSRG